jgi:hypothetical protein
MKDSDKPMMQFIIITLCLGFLTWIAIGGVVVYWLYGIILKIIS